MPQPFVQTPEYTASPLDVGGLQVTVLASTRQTGGHEMFRMCGPEGAGPGPHHHPWDETFYLLRGSLHCGLGESGTHVTPGSVIHAPAGTVHWFHFGEGGGELLSVTSAGNASRMFAALAESAKGQSLDRHAMAALAAGFGQEVLGYGAG